MGILNMVYIQCGVQSLTVDCKQGTQNLAGYLEAGVKERGTLAVSTTQPTTWKLGTKFLLLSLKRNVSKALP